MVVNGASMRIQLKYDILNMLTLLFTSFWSLILHEVTYACDEELIDLTFGIDAQFLYIHQTWWTRSRNLFVSQCFALQVARFCHFVTGERPFKWLNTENIKPPNTAKLITLGSHSFFLGLKTLVAFGSMLFTELWGARLSLLCSQDHIFYSPRTLKLLSRWTALEAKSHALDLKMNMLYD